MLDSNLTEWSELADLIEPNCTLTFEVPDSTVTYHAITGNAIFSHRQITVRAYVYETDSLGNRGAKDVTIGAEAPTKELVGTVQSVSDPQNPGLPNNLLPPSIADMAKCRLVFDYPTGLKRVGDGVIRIEQLDNYKVYETIGELFFIRFTPDRARRA